MKKAIALSMIFLVLIIFCGCKTDNNSEPPLIRLHIRANSNLQTDQSVKLNVRDAVNNYLSVRLEKIDDYDKAVAIIKSSIGQIQKIAADTLNQKGFNYGADARFCNEYFPARAYEDLIVESGNYDAVIIELGSGEGDNWWCVIYPPLCYANASQKVVYKSKIKEWFDNIFSK